MKPLLKVRDLTLSFAGLKAVQEVSFDVPAGGIVGLIGPNGAGKSSLLNCLSRIYAPDSGTVEFDGIDLLARPIHGLAPLGIARTFQNLELFGEASVADNVLAGTVHRYRNSLLVDLLRLPGSSRRRAEAISVADELLDRLGLAQYAYLPAGSLSFGAQKNVELARALAGGPRLLLLDEPAAGMNPEESRQLGLTIKRLRKERGITVVMVEHDMRLVMGTCDHIVVLVQGCKICEGPPQTVRNNPKVIKVYLGEDEAEDELARQTKERVPHHA